MRHGLLPLRSLVVGRQIASACQKSARYNLDFQIIIALSIISTFRPCCSGIDAAHFVSFYISFNLKTILYVSTISEECHGVVGASADHPFEVP